jgi:RNA polymerase sigma factor (sigma-70 family)
MAKATNNPILQLIRSIAEDHRLKNVPDDDLLRRFLSGQNQEAFNCLLRRHGPMVLSVCRSVAGNDADAEDAFQTTFLILAQKAKSVRNLPSVGSWLYGVANRTALKAQAEIAKRQKHEVRAPLSISREAADHLPWFKVQQIIHAELTALAERYRAPLVLCFLEGRTQDEAARHLGVSKTTLKRRLERGRLLLHPRLVRRGLGQVTILADFAWPVAKTSAGLPPLLTSATLKAATAIAAGQTTAGLVSDRVAYLLESGLKAMFLTKFKIGTIALMACALVPTLGGWAYHNQSTMGVNAGNNAKAKPASNRIAPNIASGRQASKIDLGGAGQKTAPDANDVYGDPLPPGAIARLGTVRFRTRGIGLLGSGVGFLADSKTLITAQGSSTIRYWDASTGNLLREIDTGFIYNRGFALSPDGKLVAIDGSLPDAGTGAIAGAVSIWEMASGKKVQTIKPIGKSIDRSTMAFSPDGKLLVSLGNGGILRLEDVATGRELLQHQFAPDGDGALAVSADGSLLAIGSGANSKKLYLWKWQVGDEPRELKTTARVGNSLAFSPDGKVLAESGDSVSGVIRLWDTATGRLVDILKLSDADRQRLRFAAFSPDGKLLIAGTQSNTDGAVHIWETATWKHLEHLDGRISRLAVSPDSRLLAGLDDGVVRVWDLATRKPLSPNNDAHQGNIGRIAETGTEVVTASDDHTVRIWDAATGKQRLKLMHDGPVRGMAVSPDGSKIASSSLDDTVCLWDVATGRRLLQVLGHGRTGGRRALAFTPDGKYLLSWGDDRYVRKWEVATGREVLKVATPGLSQKFLPTENLLFAGNGKTFVLSTSNQFRLCDAATGKELQRLANDDGSVNSMAISPDGRLLLAGIQGKSTATTRPGGEIRTVVASTHQVVLWELATLQVRKKVSMGEGRVGPVAFSGDGKYFAAAIGEPSCQIVIWNIANGNEVGVIKGFRGNVASLAFAADSTRVISGMDDTTALVWEWPAP